MILCEVLNTEKALAKHSRKLLLYSYIHSLFGLPERGPSVNKQPWRAVLAKEPACRAGGGRGGEYMRSEKDYSSLRSS